MTRMANKNDISVGAKFYYNNFSTRMGHCLPDYLIVTDIRKGFVTAKYENHYVYTKERQFEVSNLWEDSNLNPNARNPQWVFEKMT